ncbi:MAG TPA: tetratricopeptide repeat protein [Solirubrobacterales bacterium]
MSAERTMRVAGIVMVTAVTAVLVWMGWKQGGYFGRVFYPGGAVLCGLLIAFLVGVQRRPRVEGPLAVALGSLLLLGVLTAISLAWTPVRAAAPPDVFQIVAYAVLLVLGAWSVVLLGKEMRLVLLIVGLAGVVVGVATVIAISTGSDYLLYLHGDATLRFPIGYRNANAAFFLLCTLPLLSFASSSRAHWALRAPLIAGVTLLLCLAVLAQSRGSLPAVIVAVILLLAISPSRLRVVVHIAIAVLPVIVLLPELLRVFQYGDANPGVLPILHSVGGDIALACLGSLLLALLVLGLLEPRVQLSPRQSRGISGALLIVAIAAVTVGLVAVFSANGGVGQFFEKRWDEFAHQGTPSFSSSSTRFGLNAGSNRGDIWRVALAEGADNPFGAGAGAFQLAYLQDRESHETPRDPHSVEMLMFSELGVVGLALFAVFVGACVLAAIRSRRQGRVGAELVAGGGAACAYWFVQASYDWFWNYPAVTAIAIFLAGAIASPALRTVDVDERRWPRMAVIAALVGAVIVATPFYLAERFGEEGTTEAAVDPARALADLNRAADLNPFDPEPLLVKGVIAARLGDRALAENAFEEARSREPQNYASYYFLGKLHRSDAPQRALRELAVAHRLNPRDPFTIGLQRALQSNESGQR